VSVFFVVMLAVAWATLGILAAAVFGLFASVQNLGARMDARFDRLEARLDAHIDRNQF
jgi:L-cystine uptake protein TcyP (sodium:dicarboxylate symporter family)